jgi:hypothetical protein
MTLFSTPEDLLASVTPLGNGPAAIPGSLASNKGEPMQKGHAEPLVLLIELLQNPDFDEDLDQNFLR